MTDSADALTDFRSLPDGAGPRRLRAYNERLVLSTIQQLGPMASIDLARRTRLSAQTTSVITRSLEADGLLRKGAPRRGKVGKPLTPMQLDPDGIFSVGLRIGRRSADLILMDFTGVVRARKEITYAFPTPDGIMAFVGANLRRLTSRLGEVERARIAGLGISLPFAIWDWLDIVHAPREQMQAWQDFDVAASLHALTGLPVLVGNDATLACNGEHVFGLKHALADFAYFSIRTFTGGGLVLGGRVFAGPGGNAAAFGSIPIEAKHPSHPRQLLEDASLHVLERALVEEGIDATRIWDRPTDWTVFEPHLTHWLDRMIGHLSSACLAVTAVTDVPVIVIDGSLPPDVRTRLVEGLRASLATITAPGIRKPEIQSGHIGPIAGALGAAYQIIADAVLIEGTGPL